MSAPYVWKHLLKARRLMEEAREELQAISPVQFPSGDAGSQRMRGARGLMEIERDLNRAITQARSVSFYLANEIELSIDVDEDGETDPSDLIDP